ncbi:hypothetical protein MPER_12500 [Moniliophthora perniciosa FA553]|nr:hypothetical protein MPER_12500 [Moniliophthora perniciosa FA553]
MIRRGIFLPRGSAEDYRAARQSLLSLRGLGDWSQSLKELKPEDIRGINERLLREEEKDIYCQSQKLAGVSEKKIKELLSGHGENIITVDEAPNLLSKRQPPSWIWYIGVIGDLDNAKAIESSLRVEWCKAHFCIWRARWWKDHFVRRQGVSRHLAEGLRAYAMEQSELEMTQATTWSATWSPLRQRLVTITSALKEDHDLDAMLQQLGTLTVELDLDPEDDVQGVDDDVE